MKNQFIFRFFSLVLFSGLVSLNALAQTTGKITGRVTDKKNGESLIGLTVKIKDQAKGASTDVEGRYTLSGIAEGRYTLSLSYIGYPTKNITDVEVKGGQVTVVDIQMDVATGTELKQVVVNVSAKQESLIGLYAQMKNSATISSGVSSELIRRSPDKNTSEVLRRVSGASIQDNKFVVVRGLSDRYNSAQINGAILPSSEPDKKAFSFDIFPSNLIDRIVINKTASPDLPGDFAGGVIQVLTKDVPDLDFVEVSAGTGYNTQSTGRSFISNSRGSTDWLGFASRSRNLSNQFPGSRSDYAGLNESQKASASRLLPNSYTERVTTALPIQNYQLTLGGRNELKNGGVFGQIISLTYRNSQNLYSYHRNDWDSQSRTSFAKDYNDDQNKFSVTWGGLANFSYKKGNNKFSWKHSYNRIFDELYYTRSGVNNVIPATVDFRSNDPVQRSLYNTQLDGEHLLNDRNVKLNWNLNYANISREQTDLRTILYTQPLDKSQPAALVDRDSRRFFSGLHENNFGGSINLSLPIGNAETKNFIKAGFLGLAKSRSFVARIFQYEMLGSEQNLRYQSYDQIFSESNISPNGFVLDEFTNETDKYDAQSLLGAGFLMYDGKLLSKLRLVAGARVEYYYQNLDAVMQNLTPADAEQQYLDILPSINLTYSVSDKASIRLSGSRTVARPEFRELAPFSFYDFQVSALVQGTPNLLRSSNWNADLRLDLYPSAGEAITVGGFYKYFANPIEFFANSQSNADLRLFEYQNSLSATTYGLELDFRKNLGFLADGGFLKNTTLAANGAYIYSEVAVPQKLGSNNRPLQGQSPYLLNTSLQYFSPNAGLTFSALYNRIGQRLSVVGYDNDTNTPGLDYPHWFENARDLIDLQVSKRVLKKKGELKLNVSDIFNQDIIVYQNMDSKNAYNKNKDRRIYSYTPGTTYTLSLGYKF